MNHDPKSTSACRVCGAPCRPHQIMDPAHWYLVPPALQKIIIQLYNGGRPRDGYEEAAQNAVDQVNEMIRS